MIADAIRRSVAWPGPANLAFGEHRSMLAFEDGLRATVDRLRSADR